MTKFILAALLTALTACTPVPGATTMTRGEACATLISYRNIAGGSIYRNDGWFKRQIEAGIAEYESHCPPEAMQAYLGQR